MSESIIRKGDLFEIAVEHEEEPADTQYLLIANQDFNLTEAADAYMKERARKALESTEEDFDLISENGTSHGMEFGEYLLASGLSREAGARVFRAVNGDFDFALSGLTVEEAKQAVLKERQQALCKVAEEGACSPDQPSRPTRPRM
ncbi:MULTISPECIES: hypothetical protein [unclassified Thioalkalivibrio]|uniref:hypothetical protein n=1 Tax=unclassified Thioalkalivibrio TaxID=2621013 RepID=UPI000374DBC0|nr:MULTISPECIES: hypothetical protein [unclassified Thioalkalivibrio]